MRNYRTQNLGNLAAAKQNAGICRLDFYGKGRTTGDVMSPTLSYWDGLGRQICFDAYDIRGLLKKVSAQDLRAEGIKRIRLGRRCSVETLEKVAEALGLRAIVKERRYLRNRKLG